MPVQGRYWDFAQQGEPYRAIILRDVPILDTESNVPLPLPKLTVMYAAPTMDISQRIGGLAEWIAFATILLVAPSLVLSIWSIRRTLVPLNNLAHEAQSISVDNWQFRPSEAAKAAQRRGDREEGGLEARSRARLRVLDERRRALGLAAQHPSDAGASLLDHLPDGAQKVEYAPPKGRD